MPGLPHMSVLLPYRDSAATLDEALESVLSQRNVHLEVIAVDDGSVDGGPAIASRWARRDRRVHCLRGTGTGMVDALMLASHHVRAGILARMDADDIALPGRFEQSLRLLDSDGRLGAVGTRVEAVSSGPIGDGLLRYIHWQNGIVTADRHDRDLFVESPLCHPSTVIRRDAFDAVGGYRKGPFPEDYDLWLRLRARGWRLAKVPEVLLRWRHHGQRATFSDPRFALERFRALKAEHLAPRLLRAGRPVAVWGAGPTGKRLARALEPHGVVAQRFVDIDPRKIGRTARGVDIVHPSELVLGSDIILVAVGTAGARSLIRAHLLSRGFIDTVDFVCTA
jgi:glycosyltransferase involved in cell wall biosynthesis